MKGANTAGGSGVGGGRGSVIMPEVPNSIAEEDNEDWWHNNINLLL